MSIPVTQPQQSVSNSSSDSKISYRILYHLIAKIGKKKGHSLRPYLTTAVLSAAYTSVLSTGKKKRGK